MTASRYVVLACAGIMLITEVGCRSNCYTKAHAKILVVQQAKSDNPVLSVENLGGRIPRPGLSLAVWSDGFVVHSVADAHEASDADYRVGFASDAQMRIIVDLARAIFTYPEPESALVGIGIGEEVTTLYCTSGPEIRWSQIRPAASVLIDYVRSIPLRDAELSGSQTPHPIVNWKSIRRIFESDKSTD